MVASEPVLSDLVTCIGTAVTKGRKGTTLCQDGGLPYDTPMWRPQFVFCWLGCHTLLRFSPKHNYYYYYYF